MASIGNRGRNQEGPAAWYGAACRRLLRTAVAAVVAAFLLWGSAGEYRTDPLDLEVDRYRYSVIRWEASNFMDKWVHELRATFPWTSEPSRQERIALVREYFALGQELRAMENRSVSPDVLAEEASRLQAGITALNERREAMRADVEETVESEIGAVLAAEGFASRIGVIFPPVDTVFARSPAVLVTSPRDRIARLNSTLLQPGIDDEEREALEELVLEQRNLSAVVVNTGGVAFYPSVVSPYGSLHDALVTTAHEWLHHWFFFQPLGQNFWDDPNMVTLNETAATLGSRAIGDRALTAMTGEVIDRSPPSPPAKASPAAFDFVKEMRQTRLATERLLSEGKIEEAEAYMEKRRTLLVENGYFIRKINQAYFAFHGSYATSAASVSPIEGLLRELWEGTGTVGGFIKTAGSFGSYQGFLDHLAALPRP